MNLPTPEAVERFRRGCKAASAFVANRRPGRDRDLIEYNYALGYAAGLKAAATEQAPSEQSRPELKT